MAFGKNVTYNNWFTSRGNRVFLFDTYNTRHNTSNFIQQCRCDYKIDTHQVIINYNLNVWIDTNKGPSQLKRWIYQNYGISRSLCTAEIIRSVGDRRMSRIQLLWLSKAEPSADMLLDIEKRILQLSETAKVQVKDLDVHHKKIFKRDNQEAQDTDEKKYVMDTSEIINAIERGEMYEYSY